MDPNYLATNGKFNNLHSLWLGVSLKNTQPRIKKLDFVFFFLLG
jgi:hypothetical protein